MVNLAVGYGLLAWVRLAHQWARISAFSVILANVIHLFIAFDQVARQSLADLFFVANVLFAPTLLIVLMYFSSASAWNNR